MSAVTDLRAKADELFDMGQDPRVMMPVLDVAEIVDSMADVVEHKNDVMDRLATVIVVKDELIAAQARLIRLLWTDLGLCGLFIALLIIGWVIS